MNMKVSQKRCRSSTAPVDVGSTRGLNFRTCSVIHVGFFSRVRGSSVAQGLHLTPRPTSRIRNNNNRIRTRRAGKLYEARSQLYRSQILQINTRWKALDEPTRCPCVCTAQASILHQNRLKKLGVFPFEMLKNFANFGKLFH